jgi:multisubunit Na+/H+ antiporter MnhB subunit
MEMTIIVLKFVGLFAGIVALTVGVAVAISSGWFALNHRRHRLEFLRRERRAARRDRVLRKG